MWWFLVSACAPEPAAQAPRALPPADPPAAPAPGGREAKVIPPDGKIEDRAIHAADGTTRRIPMIHLMDGGTVVLVDTDGSEPRRWEEQYKRKGDLPAGWFSVHKTDTNDDEEFADEAVDREGAWWMDEQGNLHE